MRWLVFLAKTAFICNVAFLLCLIPYTKELIVIEVIQKTVIILAVLSFLVNIIVNIAEIILAVRKRPSPVRLWLRAFNFIIFSLQIAYYLLLNHAQYL